LWIAFTESAAQPAHANSMRELSLQPVRGYLSNARELSAGSKEL
jgi:hypothetical protein